MYQEKGLKTILDDAKAQPIYSASIKEDELIKYNETVKGHKGKLQP